MKWMNIFSCLKKCLDYTFLKSKSNGMKSKETKQPGKPMH
jgi:hypothetical protein